MSSMPGTPTVSEESSSEIPPHEAEPAKGTVSYVSPVARALMGKTKGDTAMVGGGEVEIVAVG